MKLRLKYNAPVVLTFALISGILLLISQNIQSTEFWLYFSTGRGGLLHPSTWLSMFLYVLGHASIEHYVNNMMFFLLVGPVIEEKYGSMNTLFIILITAFTTALFNMIFSSDRLTGASGVVFCFIILASMTSFSKGEIPLTMIVVLALYLGQEVYNMIFTQDNVSQLAHIVGGIIGAIYGFIDARVHT